jgi:hypothetical protein
MFGSTGFAEIDTVVANVANCANGSLSPGTTYWYRVQARNSDGCSACLNVDSATPRSSAIDVYDGTAGPVSNLYSVPIVNGGNTYNIPVTVSGDGTYVEFRVNGCQKSISLHWGANEANPFVREEGDIQSIHVFVSSMPETVPVGGEGENRMYWSRRPLDRRGRSAVR